MSQTIDMGYHSNINTLNINEKFVEVFGRNGILKGYNVIPGTGLTVNVNLGTDDSSILIVDGAKIKETSAINGIVVTPNISGSLRTDTLYATYNHGVTSTATYVIAPGTTSVPSATLACKIAEIDVPSGASTIILGNIRPEIKLLSLSALDTKINTTASNAATNLASHVTTMHVVATSILDGLMAKGDKSKIDGIASGAEVNQLAWSLVSIKKADTTLTSLTADTKTDTLYVEALDGIDFIPDAVNNKYGIKVVLSDTSHGSRLGGALHAVVTGALNGFMLSTDKTKLDTVATNAEVNQFAFSAISDGTNTAAADSKTDTLRVRSASSGLTVAVVNDDATYGDELLFTLAPGSIIHSTLGTLNTDDHTQYMHNTIARAVSAVHTFNPGVAGVPFILGANAVGQLIPGLNAEKLGGQLGTFYQTADNLNAGTLPAARFSDTSHGVRGGDTLHAIATQALNGFMSAVDKLKVDRIKAGTSAFLGNGTEVTIPHGLAYIPVFRTVNPLTNPNGYLGEVWVRADITNIYVGNSGTHTGAFQWFVM